METSPMENRIDSGVEHGDAKEQIDERTSSFRREDFILSVEEQQDRERDETEIEEQDVDALEQNSRHAIDSIILAEENDKISKTTVRTFETSTSVLAGALDQTTEFRLDSNILHGGGDQDDNDMSSLHGDGNATIDWLNNQMQIAINSGILDVTCKNYHGQLHLDKFGSGNRGKCIFSYEQWYTPNEFESFSGRAQCKDWKRSIKFQDRSLLQLIELNIIKVHAVSCTCTSCWNGESEGPVRYHDTRRKSSNNPNANVSMPAQTASKRLYTHSTTRPVVTEHLYVQAPSAKQFKFTPGTTQALPLNGTLVQNSDGTLRLVQSIQATSTPITSQQQQQQQQQQEQQEQTITLLVSNKPDGQKQMITKPTPSSVGNSQGIPLGLAYAPMQVVCKNEVQTLPKRPDSNSSSGLLADLRIIEETVLGMQSQMTSLRSQIKSLRAHTERTITHLNAKLVSEKMNSGREKCESLSKEPKVVNHQKLCVNCNKLATLTCATCQRVFYCGEFCVRKDAFSHRELCVPLRTAADLETVNID